MTKAFGPAHWVSAKTPMRGEDIVGAQRALADLGHYRPWPDLGFQPVAERRLFEGLKAFQKANGLEPDGVMGPAGPTAQTLDAARHAKATAGARRPARDVLGRGANLPLDLPVGEGGANREADVKAAKAALGVLGYYPPEKARRPDGRTGKADGHDFEFGLGAFQRRFGLKPDRRMDPFGPTQAKLDELLQPPLDRAFGFDIENPANGADRAAVEPLLISADPDAEPQTQAEMLEALRAHGLAHMAETRRTDALYGFDSDDTPDGGVGEDRLEAEPETAEPAGEDEDAARPEAAERGDAAKQIDDATDEADGVEAAAKELHHTLETVAPDLSGRQVVELLNLAEEHGIDAGDDEALAELADWVRENRPDFATPLRARLEGGELGVDELARRTAFHARRLKSGAGQAHVARARLAAHAEVLRDAYMREGASAAEATRRVSGVLAEATRGNSSDNVAAVALAVLEFVPVLGEPLSLAQAAKLGAELEAARKKGDDEAAARLEIEHAMALGGAVPLAGAVARGAKMAAGTISPFRFAKRQKARQKLQEFQSNFEKPFESVPATRFLSEKTQEKMGPRIVATINSVFSRSKGNSGQRRHREWLDAAGVESISDNIAGLLKYIVHSESGESVGIYLDEITRGRIRRGTILRLYFIVDKNKNFINEVKVAAGGFTKNQKRAYPELEKPNTKIVADPSSPHINKLPAVEKDVEGFRIPFYELDENDLIEDVTEGLRKSNVKEEYIEEFTNSIKQGFELDRMLRSQGRANAASSITLAAVFGASIGAISAEIYRQESE